ncbi:hypothetical protein GF373_05605 [bacterium]|nr:hypothetical protein [bacterium]
MKTITFISLYDEFCLDLRYTSAMLRHDGHHTETIFFKGLQYGEAEAGKTPPEGYCGEGSHASAKETELLLTALKNKQADLIVFFFTAPYFGLAKYLTHLIKENFSLPVAWAGRDATFAPEDCIQTCDIVCLGEPEHPIRHLVQAMDRRERYDTLPGLWNNENGAIQRNSPLHLETEIDRFPYPDFDRNGKSVIVNNEIIAAPFPPRSHLHTNFIIRVSRNCPFTCPYCQSPHDGIEHTCQTETRLRSVDNVIEEIKYRLHTWPTPIERIEFHDEFFPMDRDWVAHFHQRYSTEISLPFYGYTRPHTFDPDVLACLRDARMQALMMRIPAVNAAIQENVFHQTVSADFIKQSAQTVMDSGIRLLLECMVSNPLESDAERKETIALIGELPKRFAVTHHVPFSYYPNCKVAQQVEQAGRADLVEQPEGWHTLRAIPTKELLFWECLYTLAHFEGMEKETVLHFTEDTYMKEKPELLKEMVENLFGCVYQDNNPLVNKDMYILDQRWRLTQAESQSKTAPVRQAKRLAELFR